MPETRPINFSKTERETLYKVLASRRDMRHFVEGTRVSPEIMDRLFQAAHMAPSVGLMQPWRFIKIEHEPLREEIAKLVDEEIHHTANEIGARKQEFLKLKLEGIRTCAELVAVVLAPDDGTILGRRTLPQEMALCSAACAIENMWLAARAENLGLGWVSLFDPQKLGTLLHCPRGALPIALLCIGEVAAFYEKPMLVEQGWRDEKPIENMVFGDRWPEEDPDEQQGEAQ